MTRKQKWVTASAVMLTITIVLIVWAFWVEPRRLLLREHTIVLPSWPAENMVTLAVLSDLHVGSPHHGIMKLREIVDRVNTARPDAVLLLGDLVIQGVMGGTFVTPEVIANELQRLESAAGTFAVLGNHDWWLDGMRVRTALNRAAIRVLEDSAQNVATQRANFWLAGVSDYWEAPHDVARALREIPSGAPIIIFTHNPDVFPSVPSTVALTIAGHTHGGQVNLPLIGPPIIPSDYGRRFAKGHIIERGRHLFVTSGTGTSILPIRFRVPPEILLLTIRGR